MNTTETSLLAAGIAAAATNTAVLIGSFAAHLGGSQSRRRSTYGDALRTVVAWTEMSHRLRRRNTGLDAEMIDRFHTLQEDLAYHQGRIGSESKFVERSFIRLILAAKSATKDPIKQALGNTTVDLSVPDSSNAVDVSTDIELFLKDVRAHLSPWPWRKFGLAHRNRKNHK